LPIQPPTDTNVQSKTLSAQDETYFLEDNIPTDQAAAEMSETFITFMDSETILPVAAVASSTALPYYITYGDFAVQIHYKPMEDVRGVLDNAKEVLLKVK
jgi:hypothetical protein